MQFLSEGWSRPLLEITGTLQNPGIHKKEMVKITNLFGDVKTGKQEGAVYQRHYGKQIRRTLKEKKNANTEVQLQQRARFKAGINFAKGLTKPERDFIKTYMTEAGITAPDGLPTTWYTYAKKIAMSVPRVVFETEAGEGGFSGAYATWSYRKPITLTNSGSGLTDYQMLITLTTGNFDYSKCKADGSDLRFAQADETTPLSYWIEDWNYNGTSKVWVKVDSVPAGENVCLYLYYGKASTETESNGTNVFPFFDDFHRPNSAIVGNGWTDTGACAIENNKLKQVGTDNIEKAFTLNSDLIIEWTGYVTNTGSNNEEVLVHIYGNEANQFFGCSIRPPTTVNGFRFIYNGCAWCVTGAAAYNTDYRFKFIWHESSSTMDILYYDGSWHTKVTGATGYTSGTTNKIKVTGNIAGQIAYVYFIYVRKSASAEPTFELENEETNGEGTVTLKAFTIQHPALKSYEVLDTTIKEEGLSNLETHISTSASRANLEVAATTLKVVTLADQEYLFEIL